MELVITTEVPDAATHSFGEQPPRRKTFEWVTDVVSYDNLTEQRNQIAEQPRRHWFINWRWIDREARDKLLEIALRAKGRFDTFLFEDWDELDYACGLTDWSYTAAGGETTTQLQKTYFIGESEQWTEDKKKIQPGTIYAPTVKIDAVTKTEDVDFTLDDTTGLINWAGGAVGSLALGEVVTADYRFYFPVNLAVDDYEDLEHYINWWRTQPLHLIEDLS
jgi:uncharacterized protein (TIGR02217 family)